MNYAGQPIGLQHFPVHSGARGIFAARVERAMCFSRLRWSVADRGLVLVNAWVGLHPLISVNLFGPALVLDGEGTWRFEPVNAGAGWEVSIEVENVAGCSIRPRALAFWGKVL